MGLTQATFRETPYEDQSWEIVGAPPQPVEFVPAPFTVLPRSAVMTDPMFADYGGVAGEGVPSRFHLPEGVEVVPEARREQRRSEEEIVAEYEGKIAAARQAALEEGRAEVRATIPAQLQQAEQRGGQRIENLLKDVSEQLRRQEQYHAEQAIALAVQIAQKLMRQAVEINPEYLVPLVREGLGLAGSAVVKRVRVSPQDAEFLTVIGAQKLFGDTEVSWEFVADESIRAGCILESSAGQINLDLDAAWQRISDAVVRSVR